MYGYCRARYAMTLSGADAYKREVLADSPASYWTLGDTSGTTAVDLGSLAKDGTYTGTWALNQSSLGTIVNHGSAQMTAGGGYIEILGSSATHDFEYTNPLTLETWILTSDVSATPTIISKLHDFGSGGALLGRGYYMQIISSTTFQFTLISTYSTNWNGWTATIPISGSATSVHLDDGKPHHLVAVYDGNPAHTPAMYIDGVACTVTNINNTLSATILGNGLNVRIGNYIGGANISVGTFVSDVAIYNTALSAARIRAHYQASGWSMG